MRKMLACTVCLKRAMKPFLGANSFPEAPSALRHVLPLRTLPRFYSIYQEHTTPGVKAAVAERAPRVKRERRDGNVRVDKRARTASVREELAEQPDDKATPEDRIISKEDFLSADSKGPSADRSQRKLNWAVGKHLEFMSDPWKIAKHVEATLKKDRFDEALLLTKRASVERQCVVAWNHLIDYEIRKQKRLTAAIKLYNDMKKRGQLPNEQTYTIIFRGATLSQHPESAVQKSVHLYKSLLKGERTKPNTIHLNAVLQVCGRAGDFDTMFEIAESADAKEGRGADAHTYTIILNSLRFQVQGQHATAPNTLPERSLMHDNEARRKVVERSRDIWEEVMREWRNGKLRMDENLVDAMCRILLLIGSEVDRPDIFKILEQTMSIPNYTHPDNLPVPEPNYVKRMNRNMKNIAAAESQSRKQVPGLTNVTYAVPGRKILGLIFNAIRKTKKWSVKSSSVSAQYWHAFTNIYGVKPDNSNYLDMLSIFERNGSSGGASKLLAQMSPEMLMPTTIRAALDACIGDRMNPRVFENATAILDMMPSSQDDVIVLFKYHLISRSGTPMASGEQMARGINNLWAPFLRLRKAILHRPDGTKISSKTSGNEALPVQRRIKDTIQLARNMIGTIDRIVTGNMIQNDKELSQLKEKRNSLNRFVVEYTDPQQHEGSGFSNREE